jgi:hypothetical protein
MILIKRCLALAAIGAALLSSACMGPPVLSASSAGCSSLIPQDWKNGVAGAEIPQADTIGNWISFGDAQTGKLDQANGRTADAIGIIERCEARDAAAIKRAQRNWIQRLFGEQRASPGQLMAAIARG